MVNAVGEESAPTDVSLTMGLNSIGEFFPLLLQGFHVTAWLPCTVRGLLCDQFGLDHDYVTERITTIFLDGKAADNLDEALVRNMSTIALSAAMPGLVGATVRRGSFYAAMRSGITFADNGQAAPFGEGIVNVKLFNLLLTELGPLFLKKGIVLSPAELAQFLIRKTDSFWRGLNNILINGKIVEPASLQHGDTFAQCQIIQLSVEFIA